MYIDTKTLKYLIYYSFKEVDKDIYDSFIYKFKNKVSINTFLDFLLEKEKITRYALNNFKTMYPNQSYNNFLLFIKDIEIYDDELVFDIFSYLVSFYCAENLFVKTNYASNILIFNREYDEISKKFEYIYKDKEKDKFVKKTYISHLHGGNEEKLSLKKENLPIFLENYKLYFETDSEDDNLIETNDGIYFRKDKKDIIDELISQLEALSLKEIENELLKELKKELGL